MYNNNTIPEPPKRYGVSNRPVILLNTIITIIGLLLITVSILAVKAHLLNSIFLTLIILILMACSFLIVNALQKARIIKFRDQWWLKVAHKWFRAEYKIALNPFDLKRVYQGIPVKASGDEYYVLIRLDENKIPYLDKAYNLEDLFVNQGYSENPRYSITQKETLPEDAFIGSLPYKNKTIYYTNAGSELKDY